MTIIEKISGHTGAEIPQIVTQELRDASASDDEFRKRLEGPIYEQNADVARFTLTTLSEDAMIKETLKGLLGAEEGALRLDHRAHPPQRINLPDTWNRCSVEPRLRRQAQEVDVHRLGNLRSLPITARSATSHSRTNETELTPKTAPSVTGTG